jgi:hypothetical protein
MSIQILRKGFDNIVTTFTKNTFSALKEQAQGLDVSKENKETVNELLLATELLKEYQRKTKRGVPTELHGLTKVNTQLLRAYKNLQDYSLVARKDIKEKVERMIYGVESKSLLKEALKL